MGCNMPKVAQRRPDGSVGFHDKPGDLGAVRVPCGRCLGCRLDRASSWSVRCQHEAQLHEDNSFVTLTYDEKQLPSDLSLDYSHVQLFLKRLRRKCGYPVRFFAAGEYGTKNERPHYHLLLFGHDWKDKKRINKILYESDMLSETWGKGFATTGAVTPASASYVARYSLKKVYGRLSQNYYGGRKPEFVNMSRRPGIGAGWYEKFSKDVLPRDYVIVSGRKVPVPRYYLNKLKEASDEAHDLVTTNREIRSIAMDPEASSFDRLADREEVTRVKHALLYERKL